MKKRLLVVLVCVLTPLSASADGDMINEDWVIPSGEAHLSSFTLAAPVPVRVEMSPVKDCDKGVTLRLVPAEDYDACAGKAQGACRSRGGFDGFKVRAFSHTEPVPAGRWTFYVANTENFIKRATVHVHVVINPSN